MSSAELPGHLVLLCGPGFAGKSTIARRLAADPRTVVVSLDAINERRGLDGGAGMTGDQWTETHRIARTEVADLLGTGRRVVVDDTSSLRFLRDAWREQAATAGARFTLVAVRIDRAVLRARLEENRLERRRSDIVDDVMTRHLATFEFPREDEGPIVIDAASELEPQLTTID